VVEEEDEDDAMAEQCNEQAEELQRQRQLLPYH
jgi:hypothetical protein